MEEVDRIIIDSLKHIHCNIDDEVTCIKQFEPNLVLSAIATCLENINPDIKLPKMLPASMSGRIKTASNVAQHIRDIGFKGDMGYQTILYSNEIEVRRVLMFLIERLPKETSPVVLIEPTGYVSRIVNEIENSLKQSLNSFWLPTTLLDYGTREGEDNVIVNSFGNSCFVDSVNLLYSESDDNIPVVTEQCTKRQLIPSLLYKPADFTNCFNWKDLLNQGLLQNDLTQKILEDVTGIESIENISKVTINDSGSLEQNDIDLHMEEIRAKQKELLALQDSVGALEEELSKVKKQSEEERKHLTDTIARAKIVNTTLAVLHSEENKIKLKNAIQKSQNRLAELANQWNEVKSPLLDEHRALKSSVSSESLNYHSDEHKYRCLKSMHKNLVRDYKEKSALEQDLIEKCKELNNKNNRAAYTKRILEIVGNIKKQNHEIQKVLSDTKEVQKDIHNLTGQVDRSFTLSDELIFYDCKHDETARRAYKLLAALREECNGILQAVTDMGQAERELRNLEEQVETERSKEVNDKLEKVQKDLEEIRKEIKLLL